MVTFEDEKPVESEKNVIEDILSPRLEPMKMIRNESQSELGTPKLGMNNRFITAPYLDYDHGKLIFSSIFFSIFQQWNQRRVSSSRG